MGHPRDICHAVSAAGNCTGDKMGDGDWDRDLYFWVNHRGLFGSPAAPNSDWTGISSLTQFATDQGITLSELTRYETYLWEIESDNLPSRMAYNGPKLNAQGNPTGQIVDYWAHLAPQSAGGLPAGPTQLDRRLTAVAVINCVQQGLNGQEKDVPVTKWVEVFFVEPSLARDRTSASDVYVEIVRETTAGGNAPTNPQVVRRDVPYLVK